jgi:hypothetical protein
MNILAFRKQIETVLIGLIGEYVLSPGVVTPSIRAREGEEQLDENIAVSGLEVILEIADSISTRPLYSGIPTQGRYAVRLVQWSGSDYTEAVQRIRSAYPGHSYFPIRPPVGLGPSRQCLIEISSSTFVVPEFNIQAP